MRILILNGSLGGRHGNTAKLIRKLTDSIDACDVVHLAEAAFPERRVLDSADAFVFASGVYWDSWGSPMQTFFERATPLEGDACWFGKPAACLVTMHSVGGKEVLSRMQGVLNTFGLFIPPMCALTYSLSNQIAIRDAGSHADDFWSLADVDVIARNLQTAASVPKPKYEAWQVDRANPQRIWLEDVSS